MCEVTNSVEHRHLHLHNIAPKKISARMKRSENCHEARRASTQNTVADIMTNTPSRLHTGDPSIWSVATHDCATLASAMYNASHTTGDLPPTQQQRLGGTGQHVRGMDGRPPTSRPSVGNFVTHVRIERLIGRRSRHRLTQQLTVGDVVLAAAYANRADAGAMATARRVWRATAAAAEVRRR